MVPAVPKLAGRFHRLGEGETEDRGGVDPGEEAAEDARAVRRVGLAGAGRGGERGRLARGGGGELLGFEEGEGAEAAGHRGENRSSIGPSLAAPGSTPAVSWLGLRLCRLESYLVVTLRPRNLPGERFGAAGDLTYGPKTPRRNWCTV
jgi:hypothetical protein